MAKIKKTPDKYLIYALIVLMLALVLYWAANKKAAIEYENRNVFQVQENSYPAIGGSTGLDKASKELDSQDLGNIDNTLKEIDSDSSAF